MPAKHRCQRDHLKESRPFVIYSLAEMHSKISCLPVHAIATPIWCLGIWCIICSQLFCLLAYFSFMTAEFCLSSRTHFGFLSQWLWPQIAFMFKNHSLYFNSLWKFYLTNKKMNFITASSFLSHPPQYSLIPWLSFMFNLMISLITCRNYNLQIESMPTVYTKGGIQICHILL